MKVALALATAGLLCAAAPPQVLTEDGLGLVRYGMTLAAAEAVLGGPIQPPLQGDPDNEICMEATSPTDAEPKVLYMVEKRIVTRISVGKGSNVRTAAGIKVGSSQADVERAYRGRVKVLRHPYVAAGRYLSVSFENGRRFIFETYKGRVMAFRSGYAEPVGYWEGCA